MSEENPYEDFNKLYEIVNGPKEREITEQDVLKHCSPFVPVSKDEDGEFYITPMDVYYPDDDYIEVDKDLVELMIKEQKLIPVTIFISANYIQPEEK